MTLHSYLKFQISKEATCNLNVTVFRGVMYFVKFSIEACNKCQLLSLVTPCDMDHVQIQDRNYVYSVVRT